MSHKELLWIREWSNTKMVEMRKVYAHGLRINCARLLTYKWVKIYNNDPKI